MASQTALTRRWIISAYRAGKGTKEISAIFGRCESAVRRVRQDERERGTVEPRLHLRGRKGKLTDELKLRLKRFVAARPDATLNEIKAQLALGVSVSTVTATRTSRASSRERASTTSGRRSWASTRGPGHSSASSAG